MQETQVQSLGWEDSLEEKMTTHSSILAWRIPGTEEPGGLQSTGLQRVTTTETNTFTSLSANLQNPDLVPSKFLQGLGWYTCCVQ